MKIQNFIALLPVLLVAASGLANNSYRDGTYAADLEVVRGKGYISGYIELNGASRNVLVSLQPVMPACPVGMMCAQVMPAPETYELTPIVIKQNRCGIVKTTATRDDRPVDGGYINIEVTDNSRNTCPTLAALPETEVDLTIRYDNRLAGQQVEKRIILEGSTLELVEQPSFQPVFRGKVLDVSYQANTLVLKLRYGGGCKEHAFDLEWGACQSTTLLNTTLKECKVEVLHTQGHDDFCKALITKDVAFDMSHLGAAYILNIRGTRVLVH
ncbi:MAG: hypothetical protein ACOH5I_24345 [Oligoflexus sp.]